MGEVHGVEYPTYPTYPYPQAPVSDTPANEEAGRVDAILDITEEPELASTIMQEMKTGWSQGTVFDIWGQLFPLSIFISLLFVVGMVYCAIRILHIRRAEWASYRRAAQTIVADDVPRTQLRWNRVLEHAGSDDEHKWRLAILEADIMLNELLDVQGYKGETMAEKMKQVSRSNFNSIDDAWEAHKMRNKVAHEGADFHIDERTKDHVINLYQRVFKEFGFI